MEYCDLSSRERYKKIDEKKVKSYGACCYPKGYKKLMKMFSSIFNMDFDKILTD